DLAGGLVDGEEVGAVDGDAGQPEAGRTVDVRIDGDRVVARGRFGVAVVLDDEDRRQVPHRGEVQALEEGALVRRAVADEADRDTAPAAALARPRGTPT